MPSLESIQFEVGLTSDKKILQQMRKNGVFRQDEFGPYASIQFDSQEFKFRPGKTFTVGRSVGNALIRSSAILLGDDPLSDPYLAFVEKKSETQLGQESKQKAQFSCPICHEDQKSGPRLARHLMDKSAHKELKELEELIGQPEKEGDAVDGAEEVVEEQE